MTTSIQAICSDPYREILKIVSSRSNPESNPNNEDIESRVKTYFTEKLGSCLKDIPQIGTLDKPEKGTIVRFKCMIQDSGLGSEVYMPLIDTSNTNTNENNGPIKKKLGMWSDTKEIDWPNNDYILSPSGQEFRERQVLFVTSLPNRIQAQKAKQIYPESVKRKLPLKGDKNDFGMLVKVYDMDVSFKPTQIWEFVGILDESRWHSANHVESVLSDPESSNNNANVGDPIMCIHTLFARQKDPYNSTEEDEQGKCSSKFNETADKEATATIKLISKLSGCDELSARFILMHLISRVYNRRAGKPIGSFPINVVVKSNENNLKIENALKFVCPTLTQETLKTDIVTLNSPKTTFYPQSVDEQLDAGSLQLPPGSQVFVDESDMKEGNLNDRGVRNLKALSSIINDQLLEYVFPFSAFTFETDINILVLSQGASILSMPCVIPVQFITESVNVDNIPSAEIDRAQAFITGARKEAASLPEEMSKIIQEDFVNQRKENSEISQDDLLLQMTLARLVSRSRGEKEMSTESWSIAKKLDSERRKRIKEMKGKE